MKWSTDHLDAQVECIRTAAGDRVDDVELNALVQVATITDDAAGAIDELCARMDGLDRAELLTTPYVLIGTVGEIVDKLHMCRERWGITYFAVRELDAFAPVISACR